MSKDAHTHKHKCVHSADKHIARAHTRKSAPAHAVEFKHHQAHTCTNAIANTHTTGCACTHSADTHIAQCMNAHVRICHAHTRMQAAKGTIYIFMSKHAHAR